MKASRKLILLPLLLALLCLCLVPSAGAAAEEYTLRAAGEVVLGCAAPAEKTVEVSFLNLYDDGTGGTEFYALDLDFDLTDAGGSLRLVELRAPASVSPDENDPETGHVLWMDSSFEHGIVAPVDGAIWTAVYAVPADTPAGTYTVSMRGEVVGYHPERDDPFGSDIGLSYTAEIVVKTHELEAVPVGGAVRWHCRSCDRFFADERCVVALPKDAAFLFRLVTSGQTLLPDALEPDVNGDGQVNNRDAILLFRLRAATTE